MHVRTRRVGREVGQNTVISGLKWPGPIERCKYAALEKFHKLAGEFTWTSQNIAAVSAKTGRGRESPRTVTRLFRRSGRAYDYGAAGGEPDHFNGSACDSLLAFALRPGLLPRHDNRVRE